jgi:hypothetical protein
MGLVLAMAVSQPHRKYGFVLFLVLVTLGTSWFCVKYPGYKLYRW